MLKMYDAEVLSKFPVVQHFPFGSLFSWERDAEAREPVATVHTASQPEKQPPISNTQAWSGQRPKPDIQAPWGAAKATGAMQMAPTQAPWAVHPPIQRSGVPAGSGRGERPDQKAEPAKRPEDSMPPPTRAPWAK